MKRLNKYEKKLINLINKKYNIEKNIKSVYEDIAKKVLPKAGESYLIQNGENKGKYLNISYVYYYTNDNGMDISLYGALDGCKGKAITHNIKVVRLNNFCDNIVSNSFLGNTLLDSIKYIDTPELNKEIKNTCKNFIFIDFVKNISYFIFGGGNGGRSRFRP